MVVLPPRKISVGEGDIRRSRNRFDRSRGRRRDGCRLEIETGGKAGGDAGESYCGERETTSHPGMQMQARGAVVAFAIHPSS